jgi:hypothetical protein
MTDDHQEEALMRIARFSDHAEDISIGGGGLLLSLGAGMAFGLAASLMCAGVLLLAYGVWITDRSA